MIIDEFGDSEDDDTVRLMSSSNGSVTFSGLEDPKLGPKESWISISVQIFFPFIIAGLGMVGAGIVLDIVQHWKVFETINEIFILVPALLGLKGNLEMTLASRLSTQVCFVHNLYIYQEISIKSLDSTNWVCGKVLCIIAISIPCGRN